MSRNIQEHELTAYAFGEADADLTAKIEAELRENQEAREFVEEMKRAAELVRRELSEENIDDDLVLKPEQLKTIEKTARGEKTRARKTHWALRLTKVVSVASAAVIVLFFVGSTMLLSRGGLEMAPLPQTVSVPHEIQAKVDRGVTPAERARWEQLEGRTVTMHGTDPTSTARYSTIVENDFHHTSQQPQSTFSIDVDTASYGIVRQHLSHWTMPPEDAIRVEEMINYFHWDLPPPKGETPIAVHADLTDAPWKPDHLLARVALKGKELRAEDRKPMNLVFLIDVSGSMAPADRLPLLKKALELLVDTLTEKDKIAIVVYAGATGLVLPPTPGDRHSQILAALDRLQAGGSTNGGEGIELAYRTAVGAFIEGGANRVILATDGDFNVGVTSETALVSLIEQKAKSGVFLTVLGFGMSNLNDSMLEKLADHGDGNYAYVDGLREALRILIDRSAGTLEAIAKDVKVQVEFNPDRVASYRLIGYENRLMAAHEFRDDAKDAGEMGAGHAVTMLYELVPQKTARTDGEMFTVRVRYKSPEGGPSRELSRPIREKVGLYEHGRADLKFAAAIAEFAMVLRNSPHRGNSTYVSAKQLAEGGLDGDVNGERRELIRLIERAAELASRPR